MYTDSTLKPIYDNEPYVHFSTLIRYPANFPRDLIPALKVVTETVRPEDTLTHVVTGFHITDKFVQVWETRERTQEEQIAILASAKNEALVVIDAVAEQQRLKYITGGSGQAMVYLRKEQEAKEFLADENPNSEKYPHIYGSVGTTDGSTAQAVAETYLNNAKIWTHISARIETSRRQAKDAVMEATTLQQVSNARNVEWEIE